MATFPRSCHQLIVPEAFKLYVHLTCTGSQPVTLFSEVRTPSPLDPTLVYIIPLSGNTHLILQPHITSEGLSAYHRGIL